MAKGSHTPEGKGAWEHWEGSNLMLVAPEKDAVSKMLSDHLSHALIIAPLRPGEALQAWLGTGHR